MRQEAPLQLLAAYATIGYDNFLLFEILAACWLLD